LTYIKVEEKQGQTTIVRARLAAPHLPNGEIAMFMGIAVAPLVALIAGILILFMPRLLNYIVAIYLIIIGIVGLLARYMPGSAV
jgi:general stress protein CsbA